MHNISIAIHGGAGTILKSSMTPEKEQAYTLALETALNAGYQALAAGKSALDAVEIAVRELEDCPLFNAGKGSVFTADGKHEMDASIMDGATLNAGAVTMITGIKNPISLSRKVMEQSGHVFLAGAGAEIFARSVNCEFVPESYFFDDFRHQQWLAVKDTDVTQLDHAINKDRKFGTVGAVAIDANGNLAAATSTGGMTNKKFGRVGDSPMIGAGNYANNKTCAVSCTGSGEFFIRSVVAYDVSCLMEYKGYTLQQACDEVVMKKLVAIGGDGGLIAVDSQGNIAMPFNTAGMYRACKNNAGLHRIEIYKD